MKEDKLQPGDVKLSDVIRSGRPGAELPPGFQAAVWRRIEREEVARAGLVERLAAWFLTPRLATAGLVAVVLLGACAGALRGIRTGEREARERYVASVDPAYSQR